MVIQHFSFSATGGAGRVANILANEQRTLGHNAKFIFETQTNLKQEPLRHPITTLAAVTDQYLISNKKFSTQFSLTRGMLSSSHNIKVQTDDIVHLHWVTGMFDTKKIFEITKIAKRVIWTLHDMNPFTGGCHHAHDCGMLISRCKHCPQVQKIFQKAIEANFEKKIFYDLAEAGVRFVAPSNWMKNQALNSGIISSEDAISVISNPISEIFFQKNFNRSVSRSKIGIQDETLTAIFIAEDLDDANKQIHLAIKKFLMSDTRRHAIAVGKTQHATDFESGVTFTGSLTSEELASVASAADVHISMSKAESAGMTIVEMAAIGIPSIVLEGTGSAELIADCKSGVIVRDFNELGAICSQIERTNFLRNFEEKDTLKYHPNYSANNYLQLYESL